MKVVYPPEGEPRHAVSADHKSWRDGLLEFLSTACDKSVQLSEPASASFLETVSGYRAALRAASEPGEIISAIRAIATLLVDSNSRSQNSVSGFLAQLRDATALLFDFIGDSAGQGASPEAVQELRDALLSAQSPEEFLTARGRLAESLETLRTEIICQRQRTRDLTQKLQDRVEILENVLASNPRAADASAPKPAAPPDGITFLPGQAAAEGEIRNVAGKTGYFLGVFYVQRMPIINSRFGAAIGNEVLLLASQQLATRIIQADDSIFRWQGPAFVAVLKRKLTLLQVRTELNRFLSAPHNQLFETPQRSMYLSVSFSGQVHSLASLAYPEAVEHIGTFLAQSAGS